MVHLANTLREVIKQAHWLMDAPSFSSSADTEGGGRAAVVVECSPTMYGGNATFRVRLAVPRDGDVAP